ncbi:hypothetical protein Bca4012_073458 [Brassica carinata]
MEEAIDFKQKMLNDPLPLGILDQSNEKKIITRVAHDWNEVDVRCISEILQSFELLAIDHINENSSKMFPPQVTSVRKMSVIKWT